MARQEGRKQGAHRGGSAVEQEGEFARLGAAAAKTAQSHPLCVGHGQEGALVHSLKPQAQLCHSLVNF